MLALREQEREQEAALRSERHVTIHVLEDGFTALGGDAALAYGARTWISTCIRAGIRHGSSSPSVMIEKSATSRSAR